MKRSNSFLFALLMLILIPLELVCAYLAYETIGEVVSRLYFMAVGINLILILLAIRHPTAAALGAVVLGIVIIPHQVILGHRLIKVQDEAARIVSYAYKQRLDLGEYPADLSNYEFHNTGTKKYIQDYYIDETSGGFVLTYRVGTDSTSHMYSPDVGWSYYPD